MCFCALNFLHLCRGLFFLRILRKWRHGTNELRAMSNWLVHFWGWLQHLLKASRVQFWRLTEQKVWPSLVAWTTRLYYFVISINESWSRTQHETRDRSTEQWWIIQLYVRLYCDQAPLSWPYHRGNIAFHNFYSENQINHATSLLRFSQFLRQRAPQMNQIP